MVDFACDLILLSFGIICFCGALYIFEIVVERFLSKTLPVIAETIDRIRNPENYRNS